MKDRASAACAGGRLACLVVALCVSACSTTRMVRGYVPVEYPNKATVRLEVSPGDEVKVTTDDGRLFIGKVTAVDDAGIAGVGAFYGAGMPTADAETRIPYDGILTLEVSRLQRQERTREPLTFADLYLGVVLAAQAALYIAILALIL